MRRGWCGLVEPSFIVHSTSGLLTILNREVFNALSREEWILDCSIETYFKTAIALFFALQLMCLRECKGRVILISGLEEASEGWALREEGQEDVVTQHELPPRDAYLDVTRQSTWSVPPPHCWLAICAASSQSTEMVFAASSQSTEPVVVASSQSTGHCCLTPIHLSLLPPHHPLNPSLLPDRLWFSSGTHHPWVWKRERERERMNAQL